MKKNIRILKNIVTVILFIICVSSFAGFVYLEYNSYQSKKKFEELQAVVEDKKEEVVVEEETTEEETTLEEQTEEETNIIEQQEEEKEILPEYKDLYNENNDLYGWLKIEDTVINYPVMCTPNDGEYYLHKDWNGEESKEGVLFADYRTNIDETENTIIYGHNMKNRTMFGSLREYKNESFYEKHKYIEFDTIYEKATYEIVAVSKGIAYYEKKPEGKYLYYNQVELNSEEEFNKYINNAKENSYFETGITAEYGDKLITLSTCDYWTDNARLFIVAKKIS